MVMIFSCLIDDDFFCRVLLSPSGPPFPPRRNVELTKGRSADNTLHMHRTSHSTLSAGEQGVCIGGRRGRGEKGVESAGEGGMPMIWKPQFGSQQPSRSLFQVCERFTTNPIQPDSGWIEW